jgi:hypothetical protein
LNYKLKRIDISSQSDLIPIFKSAFGQSPSIKDISQKHSTDFVGLRDIGYLAYSDQDQPVAFYGVFPLKVRINGEPFLAAQSGDTMVEKGHEKRGLFTLLANETYKLCKVNKVAGVFGFPSPSSYPGFVKKLQWCHLENINRYQFLIPTIPLAEISMRYSIFKKLTLRWHCFLTHFFLKGSPFEGSILSEGLDGVCRSEGYWKYKLLSERVKIINIKRCDVVIKFDGSLGVGDINYHTLMDLKRVIFRLKILCFAGGINRIVFYVSPNTKLDRDLVKLAIPKKGLPIGFLNLIDDVDMSKLKYCYFDMDTY